MLRRKIKSGKEEEECRGEGWNLRWVVKVDHTEKVHLSKDLKGAI